MKTAIQLRVVGMPWVPRAFLYEKRLRRVNVGGWGAPHTRPVGEWRHLLTFDPPRWCPLGSKDELVAQ
jgi:hypothetical protein